jgi:8-oxo-dGTP pyrophosphatase MutT (NUDIX family)
MKRVRSSPACAPKPPVLRPGDAAAALIQLADGRYLLQLRDARPDIFYPDHWGCFGGALDPGETPEAALVRELHEELGLDPGENPMTRFTRFTHDFGFAGLGTVERTYFHLALPDAAGLRLGEGASVAAFAAEQALQDLRMVPYDAFALWMHHNRARIGHVAAAAAGEIH